MPFPPQEWPPPNWAPPNRAQVIGRWQEAARSLPPVDLPVARLPPLLILSLDPTDRLEAAFRRAGAPLSVVRTRGDVPARDRSSLLKLGGDLASRSGLLLSWEDVGAALHDADKAHVLAEARRVAQGGTVLVWAPAPGDAFSRLWRALLAPNLPGAVRYLALGPAGSSWPEPLQHEGRTLPEALSVLESPATVNPVPSLPLGQDRAGRPSRRADLEEAITESYVLVREYEAVERTSDRPEERLRARRVIREQWGYIARYLDEYRRLAGGVLPDHLQELATRLREQ
jgi:hypothetical protein